MSNRPADSGSATVLAAVGLAAMLVLLTLGLQVAGAVIARHRAEAAADLAALAGAGQLLLGPEAGCAAAAAIANQNGATVADCSWQDMDVLITVQLPVHLGPVASSAVGRARAGPVQQPFG